MDITLSKCRKPGWLHNYKLVNQHYKVDYFMAEEICNRCGDRKFFKADLKGRVDNIRYLRFHIRQALPLWHPLFKHEYEKSN